MKILDIYNFLDSLTPFSLQEPWDNSGLNVGNFESSVKDIYICLELDFSILKKVKDNSLIISHHPIIFKPLANFITDLYPCNLIQECVRRNISLISIHTNFDKTHLNDFCAEKLQLSKLGFKKVDIKEFSIILESSKNLTVKELAKHIKDGLNLEIIRYSQANNNFIEKVFFTCGSNAGAYKIASKNSVVITGDIKYHDAQIAASMGVSFIDIPHFESESVFVDLLDGILQKNNYKAIILHSHNPFTHI